MSNYLSYAHEEGLLNLRFNANTDLNGAKEWDELIARVLRLFSLGERNVGIEQELRQLTLDELFELGPGVGAVQPEGWYAERSTEELILMLLLARLKSNYPTIPVNKCPRLFISHQRADKNYALRIARLANKNKFAFWVDVLDPVLGSLPAINNKSTSYQLLIACIIEMALINCTHVIACMTVDAGKSRWVPYEYGRVRVLPGASGNTAAWLHPDFPAADFQEYMLLGESMRKEKEIENWLVKEWQLAGMMHCNGQGGDQLLLEEMDVLPEKTTAQLAQDKQWLNNFFDSGLPTPRALKKIKIIFKKYPGRE